MSKILRRIHMYLALFLTPWVLMYTISTFMMNHREWFQHLWGKGQPGWTPERTAEFRGQFPDNAAPREKARILLTALDMDGTFNVQQQGNEHGPFAVIRQHPANERRVTLNPETSKVTIERREFRWNHFFERFHRRRGYQHDYLTEDFWAASVDFFVLAMVFWVLSGLWLWWELKVTRVLGAAALLSGIAIFLIFLRTT
ncbi:MAG: hypothetical protein FJW39_03515 [Acidobacteria bacterium]|nr:hypothetical protein [Acidobacteriota bacterium]